MFNMFFRFVNQDISIRRYITFLWRIILYHIIRILFWMFLTHIFKKVIASILGFIRSFANDPNVLFLVERSNEPCPIHQSSHVFIGVFFETINLEREIEFFKCIIWINR